MRTPCFDHMLAVLRREVPQRPVLFELFMNGPLYEHVTGRTSPQDPIQNMLFLMEAYTRMGYDYASIQACPMGFPVGEHPQKNTTSLNEGAVIFDRQTFEAYPWPDPNAFSYDHLETIRPHMLDGFRFIVLGPSGVLENTIRLVGYDALCIMLYEDPDLAKDIIDSVGSRLLAYYQNALPYESVGAIISNDDWGFNTQTFLSPDMMRKYVFPWHKKIVAAAHAVNKPAILHSCGNASQIWEDIICDMQFDGKHSYEDNIRPVEEEYETYKGRIAIMGGLDIDFLIRSSGEEVTARAKAMLERAKETGGYALGSGNSIPTYIPNDKFFAMTQAALLSSK